MRSIKATVFACAAGIASMLAGGQAAHGQEFPTRPIRLIVAQAAGGGSDITARLIAKRLTEKWGQPIVVENRPGATSIIGFDVAAKSPPDGYTWLFGDVGSVTIVPSLYAKLPFNMEKDFVPVATLVRMPYLLVAGKSVPVTSIKDIVALAKAKPGELNYASAGNGGINHLLGEMFVSQAGIKMTHVPYRGSAAAATDLVGGRVQLYFAGMAAVVPQVKTGSLTPIAVSSSTRSSAMPDVPTVAESGFPGFDSNAWFGILMPAGVPRSIIKRVNDEIAVVLAEKDVVSRLGELGLEPYVSTPEQFGQTIHNDTLRWAKVAKEANVAIE